MTAIKNPDTSANWLIGARGIGLGKKPCQNISFNNTISQLSFDQLVQILRTGSKWPVGGVTPVCQRRPASGPLRRFFPSHPERSHYQMGDEIRTTIVMCQYFDSDAESIHRATGKTVIAPTDQRHFSSVLDHIHTQFPNSQILIALRDADYYEFWDAQPLFQRGQYE